MLWREFDLDSVWDVWKELERMRERMERLFYETTYEFPPVNLSASNEDAIVTTVLPGINPEDVEITVSGKTLTLKGSRKAEEIGDDGAYHRRERWSGQFSKTIDLPFNVEADKVKGCYSKGILRITLPRAEAEKPKRIEIKAE
ncbi:MAG: hypothetical protein Fur0020_09280 [Thermodesulfovibrionia bacterium]